MKYLTHNDEDLGFLGGWLQGHIEADYSRLVELFGEPMADGFDDYKSDAEWHIRFEDGTEATLYNWKNGHNYLGSDGYDTEDITQWNVGGTSNASHDRMREAIHGN